MVLNNTNVSEVRERRYRKMEGEEKGKNRMKKRGKYGEIGVGVVYE